MNPGIPVLVQSDPACVRISNIHVCKYIPFKSMNIEYYIVFPYLFLTLTAPKVAV